MIGMATASLMRISKAGTKIASSAFKNQPFQSVKYGIGSRRMMGGGGGTGELKEPIMAKRVGEFLGFVMWMWIFHRTRHDGPVVLGWRHPWDHAPDPFAMDDGHGHGHGDASSELQDQWEKTSVASLMMLDDEDDVDAVDEEEDDEDEDED